MQNGFDPIMIFIPLATVSGLLASFAGAFLIARGFFRFRSQVNQSIAMDIELVRVTKRTDPEGGAQRPADAWKEEVLAMEKLLEAMSSFKRVISPIERIFYEIPTVVVEMAKPAGQEEILFFVAMPKRFRDGIEKQIHSFFPGAVIEKMSDYSIFTPGSVTASSVLGLRKSRALPLRGYQAMGTDSLDELANAMSGLDTEEEGAVIQVVLAPTGGTEWRKEGREIAQRMQQGKRLSQATENSRGAFVKSIGKGVLKEAASAGTGRLGKNGSAGPSEEDRTYSLTPEEQELVKAIERKSAIPAFRTNVRLLASAKTGARAEQILSHMENAFTQFEYADVNGLRVTKRVKKSQAAFDYIFRNFDAEHSMILSAEEVASILHFPISVTETPKIRWLKAGVAPPPINVPKEGLPLGYNDYRGARTDIRITDNDRRRHMYVVGQTGTGKSNFIEGLAKWDAKSGHGFCFIDPHGDAIESILEAIPRERADDVVLFDPSDIGRPIGLNMLEFDPKHPEQKTFVINEMIGIFDQLYDLRSTGGPMFEQYMRNAMLLIMEHPESGSTLMEIPRVLADEEFRRMKLSHCANPIVRDFWTKEAEKAGGEAALANMVPYITSKLTTFISNDIMRPIIAQQESGIDFRGIMDDGKILLINLSKGKIGEINARLLGMVIVGKLLMAALSRVDTKEEDRRDFYLYMDEFQNVTTDSIAQILSEARKYRLNLVLVHQFIGQLKEEISKAVFGNVGSMVSLRVGPEDAEFLEKQFAPVFSKSDLMNLDNYQCVVRLLMNNELTKPFNLKTVRSESGDREVAEALKELSRLRHGRDAEIVNREILGRVTDFLAVARKYGEG